MVGGDCFFVDLFLECPGKKAEGKSVPDIGRGLQGIKPVRAFGPGEIGPSLIALYFHLFFFPGKGITMELHSIEL